MRKRSTPIIVATAVATMIAVMASVAVAGTVTGSNGGSLTADAKIKPKKLSKKAPSPGTIEISTKTNGPSPATKAVMDFDKNGAYFTKGLPTCNPTALSSTDPSKAKEVCGKATIGSGHATASISFFGQAPLPASAPLIAFNGVPQGGKPTVVIHAYITTPVAATFVFTGVVSKYKKEGFGTRFEIEFPKLFGGSGAITAFDLKLNKKFNSKGKKRSLVSAKCPGSKKLKARIAFTYADGATLAAPVTQTCKQKG